MYSKNYEILPSVFVIPQILYLFSKYSKKALAFLGDIRYAKGEFKAS